MILLLTFLNFELNQTWNFKQSCASDIVGQTLGLGDSLLIIQLYWTSPNIILITVTPFEMNFIFMTVLNLLGRSYCLKMMDIIFRSCRECLRQYLRIEIMESRVNIACPECSERFHPNDISMILNDQTLMAKYEEFMLRRILVSEPDARWCPAPDCGWVQLIYIYFQASWNLLLLMITTSNLKNQLMPFFVFIHPFPHIRICDMTVYALSID